MLPAAATIVTWAVMWLVPPLSDTSITDTFIYERYADSDELLAHFQGFLEKFADRFSASVDLKRFAVYGEPSSAARAALDVLNPTYLGTLGGFVR